MKDIPDYPRTQATELDMHDFTGWLFRIKYFN